jgi:hypothetical protein
METIAPEATQQKGFTRECKQCKKEYSAVLQTSKFCSGACRAKWNKLNPKSVEDKEVSLVKKESTQAVPAPIFSGLSPQMQIAVNLLQKESDRWEAAFKEERDLRKKAEQDRDSFKEKLRDTEHKQVLDGIENEKPSMLERLLGSMPAPFIEQLAPVVGRLAGLIVPGQGQAALPMAGVEGQLDNVQIQILQWIASLPEELQKQVLTVISTLMQMQPQDITITINKILNLLKNGSTINAQPQQFSMFGT